MVKKIIRVLLVVVILMIFITVPVHAISNPDSISFGSYRVFENVLETGDMLFVVEGRVVYAMLPTDYNASQAFIFEVLNTAGTATLASTPLKEFGYRPRGIYLSATDVATIGLVSGFAYILRITGNPTIFTSPVGNTITATLAALDYIDQDLGDDSGVPTNNLLRNFLITMAEGIEAYDTPTYAYITEVEGYSFLTSTGGNIFSAGISDLLEMCPILFASGSQTMEGDEQENTGTYALSLTASQKWGTTVANGLTMFGAYLGINQALAGSVVLFAIVIAFAVFIYQKTESGITVLLMISATPFIGAYLGLMPIALAFVLVIFIIILLGYFFFSRGAL